VKDAERQPVASHGAAEAAQAATRAPNSALGARYRRVMRHRGHKKAIVAVAHAILVTAYHLLARGTTYQEAGRDYYDRRHAECARHRAVQALERQGYRVILERQLERQFCQRRIF
jgi:hypothetical protein